MRMGEKHTFYATISNKFQYRINIADIYEPAKFTFWVNKDICI